MVNAPNLQKQVEELVAEYEKASENVDAAGMPINDGDRVVEQQLRELRHLHGGAFDAVLHDIFKSQKCEAPTAYCLGSLLEEKL